MHGKAMIFGLALFASAAVAQTQPTMSPAQYQKLSEAPGGWAWYLNKHTVRSVVVPGSTGRFYQFWMTGNNRGPELARRAMAQVRIECITRRFVQLHVTTYASSGEILTDTLRGDDSSNWARIVSGNPTDAARAWLCR